ncbi:MAG: transposase [Oscillospiraceae bacterium]|nr:transposase [Oscillospiraceae bacterium]
MIFQKPPLTEKQKEGNRQRSKIRLRIERILGQMTRQLHGINIRSIGLTRALFRAVESCLQLHEL